MASSGCAAEVGAHDARLSTPASGDEEFDELCFDFGIELDEVVRHGSYVLIMAIVP